MVDNLHTKLTISKLSRQIVVGLCIFYITDMARYNYLKDNWELFGWQLKPEKRHLLSKIPLYYEWLLIQILIWYGFSSLGPVKIIESLLLPDLLTLITVGFHKYIYKADLTWCLTSSLCNYRYNFRPRQKDDIIQICIHHLNRFIYFFYHVL